jgi:hypothetical protein
MNSDAAELQDIFPYDESLAMIRIDLDRDGSEVTVSGGSNGLARLFEIFAAWALGPDEYDDEHWYLCCIGSAALTMRLLAGRRIKRKMGDSIPPARLLVEQKEDVFYKKVRGGFRKTARSPIIELLLDRAGSATMAKAVRGVLLGQTTKTVLQLENSSADRLVFRLDRGLDRAR